MGVILKWKLPDLEQVSYDKTEVYKSATEGGIYNLETTQDITDSSYWDKNGMATDWYKIRFKDTLGGVY